MPIAVVLPAPFGPKQREEITLLHVEIDALQRLNAVRVGLRELAQDRLSLTVGHAIGGAQRNAASPWQQEIATARSGSRPAACPGLARRAGGTLAIRTEQADADAVRPLQRHARIAASGTGQRGPESLVAGQARRMSPATSQGAPAPMGTSR